MPNGNVHRVVGTISVVGACIVDHENHDHPIVNPLTALMAGPVLSRLPDILEPAFHPNHRQFFHSWTMLALTTVSTKVVYDWVPETDMQRFVRKALLLAGVAYSGHLLLDSFTKKSLPLI